MKFKDHSSWGLMAGFLSAGLLLFIGGCTDDKPVGPLPSPLELPSIAGLKIKVLSPEDGTALSAPENTITGVVSGLPSGYTLRVLVRPSGEVWWSQPGVTILPDSTWTATIFVGIDADAGKNLTFLIGVVAIQTADDPPNGTKVLIVGQMPAVITVTRR